MAQMRAAAVVAIGRRQDRPAHARAGIGRLGSIGHRQRPRRVVGDNDFHCGSVTASLR